MFNSNSNIGVTRVAGRSTHVPAESSLDGLKSGTPRRGLSELRNVDKSAVRPHVPTPIPSRLGNFPVQRNANTVKVFEDSAPIDEESETALITEKQIVSESLSDDIIDTCYRDPIKDDDNLLDDLPINEDIILREDDDDVHTLVFGSEANDDVADLSLLDDDSEENEWSDEDEEEMIIGDPHLADFFYSTHGVSHRFEEIWSNLHVDVHESDDEIDIDPFYTDKKDTVPEREYDLLDMIHEMNIMTSDVLLYDH